MQTETVVIIIFILGYLAIALEHYVKVNKTASALLTGVLCWTLFILSEPTEWVRASESFQEYISASQVAVGGRP